MNGYTTVQCYTRGEIIDCEFGVSYNRPPEKGVSINSMITFDELETKLYHALNINRIYTKLNMVFRYPVPFPNGRGTVNYVPLPIRDDGDVSIMFTVVAQSPPPNTIEMYCQTSSIDHHPMPSSFTTPMHIESLGPSQQMAKENTSSPMYMQSYDNDMEPIVRVDMPGVTDLIVMTVGNYVDILPGNDDDNDIMDMGDNENIENNASLLGGGEHDVPSPLSRELNWDVINSMADKDLIARTGLWNESDELFKGLRFESKRLRACRRKPHGLFEITKYIGPHTCVYPKLSQDHSQLDSTFIAREIQNVVQRDHTISIAALHQIVKDKFGYNLHYKRIWEAKRKAIIRIFDDWNESYQALPRWMNIVKLTNPGTKVVWKTSVLAGCNGNVRFMRVFWAFGACVEGFKHCRLVIQIDVTFLYGKYIGKLLIATSIDANGHIFPLAFAIVEEESSDSWSWFLYTLRSQVTQREGICLISNRHAGIQAAIRDPSVGWNPPYAQHRYCLRHVASNFNDKYRNKMLKDLVYRAGSQHQSRKYESCMIELKRLDEKCLEWFNRLDTKKWTLAYDGGHRYGWMTTNIAECINGVLKGARMLPITALVRLTFYRCVSYFETRRTEIQTRIANGDLYTSYAINKITKYESRASRHTVNIFNCSNEIFEVTTAPHGFHMDKGNNIQIVKLKEKTCTCNKWQSFSIPCSHVLAQFVDKHYRMDVYGCCYTPQFNPIPHQAYWPEPNFPIVHPNPTLVRDKGRPRSTRIRNEMDWREPSVKG
ncbi:hypothetical protein PVL29_024234 [Vitis rotundifolia]|uniref:SWIM-type domain-containing protein n=1 Tax=Vitis rotundifolia TaxID=103349 RepID=A0AA39D929_VITRO|nr:hypothetical protein PVL29_024234 [Vitis rotundifolia]